jgi:hypothetical protein
MMDKKLIEVVEAKTVAIKFALFAKKLVDKRGQEGKVSNFEGFSFEICQTATTGTVTIWEKDRIVLKGSCKSKNTAWSPNLPDWTFQMAPDNGLATDWKARLRTLTGIWQTVAARRDYEAKRSALQDTHARVRHLRQQAAEERKDEAKRQAQMEQAELIETLAQLGLAEKQRPFSKGAS